MLLRSLCKPDKNQHLSCDARSNSARRKVAWLAENAQAWPPRGLLKALPCPLYTRFLSRRPQPVLVSRGFYAGS
ncbi:hypothetical protein WJX73_001809 [Symbiochloris irregularis]|uniref:Uncharacterized protein n=1 Tax=Symbiochloris irregularis TaxID=706552 RepID=A0AAW1NQ21_9CHLO